jgi:hypothetical protein
MKLEFDSEGKKEFTFKRCEAVLLKKVQVNGCKVSDINLDLIYPIIFEDSIEPVSATKHILLHKDPSTSIPGADTFHLKVDGLTQQVDIPDNIGDAVIRCVTTTPFKFLLEIELIRT